MNGLLVLVYFLPLITLSVWVLLRYYRWAKWMDKINQDHHEFQKQGLWVEGVTYWVGVPIIDEEEGG